MSDSHDPIRQLKYLRQTLSQNKKPLGFFLSAGCPLAVSVQDWPLIPDIAGLTKHVEDELRSKDAIPSSYDILLAEIKKSGKETPNIEEILSFVRALKEISEGADNIRGLTRTKLIKLEKDICDKIVAKTSVELPNSNTPYHQLAQWIQLIDRDDFPVECFTTNYDLLLEQAFEETGVAYFDGFVGSRKPFFDLRAIEDCLIPQHWTRLWKVHGSINWFLNEKQEVYRSTIPQTDASHLIHPSHLKYDQSRKMPFLAMIDRLNAFLRQPSALLITTGYSFSDVHLNDTIMNALKATPTAMVIALLFGAAEDQTGKLRFEKAFSFASERLNLSAWTFDEAVIGGRRGKWEVSNKPAIHEDGLSDSLVEVPEILEVGKERPSRHELQLGDFAKLGNFLQVLVGDRQFKVNDAQ